MDTAPRPDLSSLAEISTGAFVVEVAFLRDTVAFALGDGSVRLLSGATGTTATVHSGTILSAVPTADGTGLLTGGDDGAVALVAAAGAVERLALRPRKWIDQVAVGPGGILAFATGRQAVVRFANGSERVLEVPRAVGGIAFAPKGTRLAVARYDGVSLWWAATDAEPVTLDWKGAHLSVRFSPDNRFVVTSMQENALHGWRLDDRKDMRMSGYPAKPRSLSWSAKGRFLATSGANAAILWPFHSKDGPMNREPLQLAAREVLVTRVACHPRADLVAVGYADGMVMSAGFAAGEEVLVRRPGGAPVTALAWDARGTRLAFGTEDGTAGVVST